MVAVLEAVALVLEEEERVSMISALLPEDYVEWAEECDERGVIYGSWFRVICRSYVD